MSWSPVGELACGEENAQSTGAHERHHCRTIGDAAHSSKRLVGRRNSPPSRGYFFFGDSVSCGSAVPEGPESSPDLA